MTISEALLSEFDQEMEKTRTTLKRIPADKGIGSSAPPARSIISSQADISQRRDWPFLKRISSSRCQNWSCSPCSRR